MRNGIVIEMLWLNNLVLMKLMIVYRLSSAKLRYWMEYENGKMRIGSLVELRMN